MNKNNVIIIGLVVLVIVLGALAIIVSNQNKLSTDPEECIITVFGEEYDVSQLRYSHSGGNVYKCGTDMTQDFQAQHGTDVTRIEPYKVNK